MKRKVMEAIYPQAAGLDVHKASVTACRRRLCEDGTVESEVAQFGTTTRELQRLSDWLAQWDVRQVAMESTGVYWQAVWNLLHEQFELLLANAHQLKKVPGRKTDVGDAEWIAQLHQCGLLKGSFVPSEQVKQFRDLTRQRMKLLDQHTAVVNRIHKVLEGCNIKLATVASDIMGASGRSMLQALIAGETDAAKLAALARGKLREKHLQLVESLEGRVGEHERWLLERLMKQVEFLEAEIEVFDERLRELMQPYEQELELLDSIDGVGRRTAENILAEIGVRMSQFPSAADLSSWAGMCPGNEKSADKRRSGKTPKGNRWLRRVLTEAAWAAVKKKEGYLVAQYRRLAGRRGKKRAIVAVGRSILEAAYHIIKDGVSYKDLGTDYFDRLNEERTRKHLVKRLEHLGYKVELSDLAKAA